jgi:hypothetical protein
MGDPLRALIAGGGVAGLETMMRWPATASLSRCWTPARTSSTAR